MKGKLELSNIENTNKLKNLLATLIQVSKKLY